MNPLYAQLRDAAWTPMQANGGQLDPRVLASLDRVRDMPPQGRYVMVDTAGAQLYMIEDGRIADSMKVIVGKADPVDADADARQHDLLCDAQSLLARIARDGPFADRARTCSTRASAI